MPSSPSQNSTEPSGLLRALAAAFSGVLFGVFLSKLKAPIQQPTESVKPQNTANNSSAHSDPPLPIAVAIESYPPPAETEEAKSDKKRDRFYKGGNFIASVATVLISLGILWVTNRYTNYAGGQLAIMKRQIELQETVQSGWLVLETLPQIITDENGNHVIKAEFSLTNQGQTMTIDTNIDVDVVEVAGTNGDYKEPPRPAPIPNPSPAGEPIPQGGKPVVFSYKAQVLDWERIANREKTLIMHIAVSYRTLFGKAVVLPACFYFECRSKRFVRCFPQ